MPATDPEPIDAVVLWVDGSDPRHRAKLERHLAALGRRPPEAAPTRFSSMGEIDYCIASLLRFAPFLRRIHVVTDDQVPPVFERAARWPAALRDKLALVDHRTIFAGHEDCLPTFNSLTIETMLHRVPGLADHFVYFNDDVMLLHPVRPDDWFRAGQPVVRGTLQAPPHRRWSRRIRRGLRRLAGLPPAGERARHGDAQAYASALAGSPDRMLVLHHSPHALRRSTIERFFAAHPQALRDNIRHRLRDPSQFLPTALASQLDLRAGQARLQTEGQVAYFKPASTSIARLRRRLQRAAADPRVLFACVQSLDEARPAAQRLVLEWMEQVIGQPEPGAPPAS